MITPTNLPPYRWPSLSFIVRQYVVSDEQGRHGIAHTSARSSDILWVRPVGTPALINDAPRSALPSNAVLMTVTAWHRQPDGTYTGSWSDDDANTPRKCCIVDDLGWIIPDNWADEILAGSDQPGYWDYGAKLGKIGGQATVNGQAHNEMTVQQAEGYAKEIGIQITGRAIRFASAAGYIPGARKVGRDWLITYDGLNQYLDHRPKRGPHKT